MTTPTGEIVLRFLAAPTDVTFSGRVHGGKLLEWIDKAGYACVVGWSGRYCVTAYVGDVHFSRPVEIGELVEVRARLVHTGRSSMHVLVTVSSANPRGGEFTKATQCLTVFVAVDENGQSVAVPPWKPANPEQVERRDSVIRRIAVRKDIEAAMAQQAYTDEGTAPEQTLRFLAAPTDVNWGGKVHGGTVMRWIDEAAYVCAVGWSGQESIAVYAGGVRFYRPLLIGSVVETQARLLYTGRTSMHISVHVRSGSPRTQERALTTHCLIVFVALDDQRGAAPVPSWQPANAEDVALRQHAVDLIELRARVDRTDSEEMPYSL
jgi:4-hydroxybenzoyl-CoA thioesterase